MWTHSGKRLTEHVAQPAASPQAAGTHWGCAWALLVPNQELLVLLMSLSQRAGQTLLLPYWSAVRKMGMNPRSHPKGCL